VPRHARQLPQPLLAACVSRQNSPLSSSSSQLVWFGSAVSQYLRESEDRLDETRGAPETNACDRPAYLI
jgi:hypothetical protein